MLDDPPLNTTTQGTVTPSTCVSTLQDGSSRQTGDVQ
jgi:hypothetical protein